MHSQGPAHPALSRCHGRPTPFPVTDEPADKLQNCTQSARVQSEMKTPNYTRPRHLTEHPTFHKSILTHPTQANPQIDSTTPVAEDTNDSTKTPLAPIPIQIRFKVRGGFRPYPLARCPDKPCCGGFTHHPSSPPSNKRTEPALNGVKPLVKCHTHLRLFLVVLQHPCLRVSSRCPVAGSWASSSDSTSGGVGVWGGRSGVGFAGRLPEWFRHSRSLALTSWLNQL